MRLNADKKRAPCRKQRRRPGRGDCPSPVTCDCRVADLVPRAADDDDNDNSRLQGLVRITSIRNWAASTDTPTSSSCCRWPAVGNNIMRLPRSLQDARAFILAIRAILVGNRGIPIGTTAAAAAATSTVAASNRRDGRITKARRPRGCRSLAPRRRWSRVSLESVASDGAVTMLAKLAAAQSSTLVASSLPPPSPPPTSISSRRSSTLSVLPSSSSSSSSSRLSSKPSSSPASPPMSSSTAPQASPLSKTESPPMPPSSPPPPSSCADSDYGSDFSERDPLVQEITRAADAIGRLAEKNLPEFRRSVRLARAEAVVVAAAAAGQACGKKDPKRGGKACGKREPQTRRKGELVKRDKGRE